jgi:hypothetical protein
MGEDAAVAAGSAAASLLLELLLLGLDGGHLRLAAVAADWLLDRHHLVGLGFVGRPKSVHQRRQGADVAVLLFAEKRPVLVPKVTWYSTKSLDQSLICICSLPINARLLHFR